MMARRGVLGLLAGGAVALLSACNPFGGNSYRFRMTVEVETPEGLRRGSSVYEVKGIGTNDLITGDKGARSELRGEAVAVDMPNGQTLFVLLLMANGTSSDDNLAPMSMKAMDPAYRYNFHKEESAQRISSGDGIRSPADVAEGDYPMLVTFTDIDDPKSVQRVDPANLAASFGPGIRLKRITVEVTDDDVTTGIEKRLGWRKSIGPNQLSGDRFEDFRKPELSAHLSAYSFSTEHPK
jgi:hypothetical protein